MKRMIILLSAVLIATIIPTSNVFAFAIPDFFGGSISKVTYCPCAYDLAWIISVKDLVTHHTINVKYSLWESKIDANYNIFEPGPNVIGGFTAGYAQCLQQSGYYCKNNSSAPSPIIGVIDWVRGIGSSKYGAGSLTNGGL